MIVLLLAACASQVSNGNITHIAAQLGTKIDGASEQMFGKEISTWEVLERDKTGQVVGLTMPLSIVRAIDKKSETSVNIAMPSDVKESTFIDHVAVQYEARGLNQDFQKPIFLFRFYSIDSEAVKAVDCADHTRIDGALIVDGYTNPSEDDVCKNGQGFVSVQKNMTEDPDHPSSFGRINFGYYKGKMIFIEVAVTLEKLQSEQSFTLTIPTPSKLGSDAQIPANFTGTFQAKTQSYDLSIWSFSNPDSPTDG